MNATWFLVALAILQAGVAISIVWQYGLAAHKVALAGVFVCYGIANLLNIWVAKG
jgi:hypothetical protein